MTRNRITRLSLLGCLLAAGLAAAPATKPHKGFPDSKAAAEALIAAAEAFDQAALREILGPGAEALINTGEPVKDREAAQAIAREARAKLRLDADPKHPERITLVVGNGEWPLPMPLVQKGGQWRFDGKAGLREVLQRRIGWNELDAIQICHGFVEAQQAYARMKGEEGGPNQYAQRILSSPGKQDGLAWQLPDGSWGGPVGPNVARAIAQGYAPGATPYHGYYFKALKGQGPAAPMGELDFVVKGLAIGGFALVAAPAEYGVTGVKSFLVSHDGIVYEQDLGKEGLKRFKAMERYNPDKGWKAVEGE